MNVSQRSSFPPLLCSLKLQSGGRGHKTVCDPLCGRSLVCFSPEQQHGGAGVQDAFNFTLKASSLARLKSHSVVVAVVTLTEGANATGATFTLTLMPASG